MSQPGKLKRFLYSLDFLGHNIGLELDSNTNYKTIPGAFVTIISFISCLIIAIIFGKEIFERDKPFFTSSEIFDDDSTLDFDLLNIKFYISNYTNPNILNLNDAFQVDVFTTTILNGAFFFDYNYELTPCTEKEDEKYLCINRLNNTDYSNIMSNITLKGHIYDEGSTTFAMRFNSCKGRENCNENSNIEFYQLTINIYTDIINPFNYTNPISSRLNTNPTYTPFSTTIQKESQVSIAKNELITDKGWIFEEDFNMNYFTM